MLDKTDVIEYNICIWKDADAEEYLDFPIFREQGRGWKPCERERREGRRGVGIRENTRFTRVKGRESCAVYTANSGGTACIIMPVPFFGTGIFIFKNNSVFNAKEKYR